MKANSKIKLIALSVSLLASSGAPAALGGLRVNSGLGEPFSGTVTVTGKEAKELLKGTKPAFSDGRLKANVRKSGNDAVVSLSSAAAIKDPVIVFQMSVKGQSRQYTAVLDPASPKAKAAVAAQAKKDEKKEEAAKPAREEQSKAKEKAAAEKDKAAEQAKAQRPSEKPSEPKQPAAKTAEPGRHTVRPEETLFIIADQLRPDNMSPDQAVRALITANPKKLGGNPNRLLAGTVLTLPAGFKPSAAMPAVPSENVEIKTAKTPAEKAKPQPEAPKQEAAPEAAKPEPEKAVPDATENTVVPPQDQDVQSAETDGQQSAEPESSEPAPAAEDAQSAQPAVQESAETEEESEGGGLPWKWVLAGGLGLTVLLLLAKLLLNRKAAPKAAAAEEEESPFDQQDGIRLHQPVAKPEKPKAPITKNQAAEEEFTDDDVEDDIVFFDNTDSGDIGRTESEADFGLNLGALDIDQQQAGIMSSAVTDDEETRRRANADWDSIESTESVFEPDEFAVKKPEPAPQPVEPAPVAAKPAVAAAAEAVGFAKPAADTVAAQIFESESFAVESPAEEKPAATSWATAGFARSEAPLETELPAFATEPVADAGAVVEETVSWAGTGGAVVEEEPLAFAVEEFAVEPQAAAEPASVAFVEDTVPAASADEAAPLDFDLESVAVQPVAEADETVEVSVAGPEAFAVTEPVLDFVPADEALETAFPGETAEVAETVAVEEPALAFDMPEVSFDVVEAPAEPVQTADQPAADLSDFGFVDTAETIAPAADLSGFDVAETVETVAPAADLPDFGLVETVKAAAPAGDFAAFAEPEPAAEVALQIEPETVGVAEAEPLADPFAAAESAAEPVVEAPQASASDWQDDAEIGLADTVTFDDSQLESADDLVIDWGSLDAAQAASADKPAFVSESVGMTAPLEAKYELAEMYIEIGDPDAARETLYELIEESSGEIQAKSKALLASIGG